ncbi:glycosyltransferase family 2 protein [Terriglobus roseus]|uniref:Glycosyltransferase involved in cell wall bisynthesis n=1 Tax=Terriglobus roseus TaxID=392734 RepID=A0A1H4T713_9BACT|nr:glycosyltransferase family 2 protein [Terriglobus roseus]SEC51911.1 Glycosyltransferase involved in cell wall bisynthesis [Terriglobus roseus]
MISVVILTRNESADIDGAIRSVAFSDDVHVFDSLSTDGTQEMARRLGATVHERVFDNYAAQRNASLTQPAFRHPWLLILDADERPTPELVEEMQQAVAKAPTDVDGFRLRRHDYLWDTWLKHAQITPFYTRLVRRGRARYVREINEVLEVDGRIIELICPLNHYPFSKGIAHWVAKHNVYSTMEAQLLASGAATVDASLRIALFAKDRAVKRAAQKALFFQLPMRPLLKWFYMMFIRGAVLDGYAGFTYSTLSSFYEYLIELKRIELVRGERSTL